MTISTKIQFVFLDEKYINPYLYRHDKKNIQCLTENKVLKGERLKESVSSRSSVPVPESHYQLAVAQHFPPRTVKTREE